jgi:hypothetical protein
MIHASTRSTLLHAPYWMLSGEPYPVSFKRESAHYRCSGGQWGEPAVSNIVRDSGRSASATPFEIAPTVVQRYAWGRAKHARAVQQQLRQPAQASDLQIDHHQWPGQPTFQAPPP